MRRVLPVASLTLTAVLLAACGGGGSTTVNLPDGTTTTISASPTGDGDGGDGDGETPAAAGCADLTREEVQNYAVLAQIFPQVTSGSVLTSIRDGVIGYDSDAFGATLGKLEFLRGVDAPVGDPGESLDYYADARAALDTLLALDAPTQADFDAYVVVIGDIPGSLSKQLGINSALSEACPDLL
jgi:hypothetical protein